MSDQPETDESLPTPTPDESARFMREGSHSKVPAWKRLLPPWAFSIGLHLFVLPFVLGLTVVFADSLFVPAVWNEVRDEMVGDDPHSNLFIDRDDGVAQVHEIVVKLADVHNQYPKEMPQQNPTEPGAVKQATSTAQAPSTRSGKYLRAEMEIQGQVVHLLQDRIIVALRDGTQCMVQQEETTQVFRQGDPRPGSYLSLRVPVFIAGYSKDGTVYARTVIVGSMDQPMQPQAGTNGNVVIEQPTGSPSGDTRNGRDSTEMDGRGFLSKVEVELVDLINQHRAQKQLPPLIPTRELSDASRRWAVTKRSTQEGGAAYGRGRDELFCWSEPGLTPKTAFSGWMNSGGYVDSRMCDKQFRYIGVSNGQGGNSNIFFAFFLSKTPDEKE